MIPYIGPELLKALRERDVFSIVDYVVFAIAVIILLALLWINPVVCTC